MSDTEKPSETEVKEELAEIADLEDLSSLESEYLPSPRLKEYLHSPDSPSRYLFLLSILFAFLAVSCFSLLIFQYWKHRHSEQKPVAQVVETVKIEPTFHEPIGQFKVDWDDAEMRADLVVECSTHEACDALKEKNIQVRDVVLPVLQSSSRSEILNPSHKQILRQQIAEKLNDMKLGGRIIQVDFSDLTIEPIKN